jgi:pimeloyl-ACP methyl ester carboxylesterase
VTELQLADVGGTIRWTETPGEAPARVFVHGLGGDSATAWSGLVDRLEPTGRRSLQVDLLGHGRSDAVAGFGYTLAEHADTVASVVDHAVGAPVDVVGHSMGGAVAIVLAARRPDLVRSLLLVEPNLDPALASRGVPGSTGIASYGEREFLDGGFEEFLAIADPAWVPTLRGTDPVALHRSAVGLVRGSRPTMRRLLTAMRIPRLHVEGDRGIADDVTGLPEAGVRCVTVPDAGHVTMVDNLEGFLEAVAEVGQPAARGATSPDW